MKTEDIKLLETQMKPAEIQTSFKSDLKRVQMLFKNNSEKYEYLITNNPQDKWIAEFKQTKEYKLLYE